RGAGPADAAADGPHAGLAADGGPGSARAAVVLGRTGCVAQSAARRVRRQRPLPALLAPGADGGGGRGVSAVGATPQAAKRGLPTFPFPEPSLTLLLTPNLPALPGIIPDARTPRRQLRRNFGTAGKA